MSCFYSNCWPGAWVSDNCRNYVQTSQLLDAERRRGKVVHVVQVTVGTRWNCSTGTDWVSFVTAVSAHQRSECCHLCSSLSTCKKFGNYKRGIILYGIGSELFENLQTRTNSPCLGHKEYHSTQQRLIRAARVSEGDERMKVAVVLALEEFWVIFN